MAIRKPSKPIPDLPSSSPMAVKVPCVFCGQRLSVEDKKTHACWVKK